MVGASIALGYRGKGIEPIGNVWLRFFGIPMAAFGFGMNRLA